MLVGSWCNQPDAATFLTNPEFEDTGIYGFARPDEETALPPTVEQSKLPKYDVPPHPGTHGQGLREFLEGNAKNIEAIRDKFCGWTLE